MILLVPGSQHSSLLCTILAPADHLIHTPLSIPDSPKSSLPNSIYGGGFYGFFRDHGALIGTGFAVQEDGLVENGLTVWLNAGEGVVGGEIQHVIGVLQDGAPEGLHLVSNFGNCLAVTDKTVHHMAWCKKVRSVLVVGSSEAVS